MYMRGTILLSALICIPVVVAGQVVSSVTNERRTEQRLSFQTSQPWSPRTNLNADVVMVYGIGSNTESRIETWVQHGYVPSVMTGVAWGSYQDYLDGRFDGQNHMDQAQKDVN